MTALTLPGARLPGAMALATLLSALCLRPVFVDLAWFGSTVLVVLAVVAAGEAGRHLALRLSLPRVLSPLLGALALVVALTGVFASTEAKLGVLPDLGSLARLVELLRAGFADVASYAAPVPATEGLRLLAAGGVGLVALAVDALAGTFRRAALAGLPLIGLYTVPAAVVPGGVHAGWFALGAAGYLVLLLVEAQERVTRWGHPVRPEAGSSGARRGADAGVVGGGALAAAGRRVGLAAVLLAVLVPELVPGLGEGVLGNGRGSGGVSTGNRTVAVVNPIIDLRADLNRPDDPQQLTYTTDDPDPGYVRIVGLDEFDGDKWEASPLQVSQNQSVDRGLDEPLGLAAGVQREPRRTEMTISPSLESTWLPLPYPATLVSELEGTWLYDKATYNVFSTSASARRQAYVVEHLEVQPTPEQLRAAETPSAGLDRFLSLPAGLEEDGVVATQARKITAEADTPYDRALALQNWLRSDAFTYDEQAPDGTGSGAIEAFLTDRRGFCVHFASTMAVMARQLGIPARVGVGFLPGQPTAGGAYAVSLKDAHAWPELYFDGVGWISFEPTPQDRATPPEYARAQPGPTSAPSPSASPSASASTSPGAPAGSEQRDRQSREDRLDGAQEQAADESAAAVGGRQIDVPWRVVVLAAIVLLAAVAPFVARRTVRRRRWAGAHDAGSTAEAAWAEVRDDLTDHGQVLPGSETPRQSAARLVREAPLDDAGRSALARLAGAVERARYAPSLDAVGDLRGDVHTVRAALGAGVGWRTRWRARLLPASTGVLLHRGGERVADSFDALDRVANQAREKVLPRR